jgi:hypothetical protein
VPCIASIFGLTKRQPSVVSNSVCAPRWNASVGLAACDHEVRLARRDQPRGIRDRLEARAAEAVDGDTGDRDRKSREQRAHPADVAVVLAGLVRAAEDHVVDPLGGDLGLRDQRGDHLAAEIIGTDASEATAVPAEGRAQTVDEEGGTHRRTIAENWRVRTSPA